MGQLGSGNATGIGDEPNEMGQHLPPIDLGLGAEVTQVSCGAQHNCVLLLGGAVKCFGRNSEGQLGLGDVLPGPQFRRYETRAIMPARSAFDGFSFPGQPRNRGTDSSHMGDSLPALDLGNFSAIHLAAGDRHTCALSAEGHVACWGMLFPQGTNAGDEPGEMGDRLPTFDFGFPVIQVAVGHDYTCVLSAEGQVRCWGRNYFAQLGLGDTSDRDVDGATDVDLGTGMSATHLAVGVNSFHSCVILQDETVRCWGYNRYGQLGQGNSLNVGNGPGEMGDYLEPMAVDRAQSLAVGGRHTCALQVDDSLLCYGLSRDGQLGLGRSDAVGDEPSELAGSGELPPLFVSQNLREGLEAVRLSGGDRTWGWLEVLHNGSWALVCDDGFNSAAARVACKDAVCVP